MPSFDDISRGDYYYDAVQWAVEKGITQGTTSATFSPDENCTRAQIITFLWRAAGSPALTGTHPVRRSSPCFIALRAVRMSVRTMSLWTWRRAATTPGPYNGPMSWGSAVGRVVTASAPMRSVHGRRSSLSCIGLRCCPRQSRMPNDTNDKRQGLLRRSRLCLFPERPHFKIYLTLPLRQMVH